MSKAVDFSQSNIPEFFVSYIKNQWNMKLSQDVIADFYRVVFNTITTLLKYQRNKNTPHIGFKLMNEAGEFKLGAILDYHAPEGDDDDTGNWTLSFTFNEEDMAELDEVYDNFSDMFFTSASQEIRSTMYGDLVDNVSGTRIFCAAIDVLKSQLDSLSNSGEEIELSMPGVFMACVGFEDGQKVYSIIPGHIIKQQIKDDKGLSRVIQFKGAANNTASKAA